MSRATVYRLMLSLSALALLAALSGCGTKTSLIKPAGPATPPLLGAAPAAATAPHDSNKAVAP